MRAGAATRSRGRCSTLSTSYRDRSPGRSRHLGAGVSSHSGRSTALAFPALSFLALLMPTRLRPRLRRRAYHAPNPMANAVLAAAEQETDDESRYRGNADRFPRLIPHVT